MIYLGLTDAAALLACVLLEVAHRAILEPNNLLIGQGGEALKFLDSPQLSGRSKASSVHMGLVLRQAENLNLVSDLLDPV